MNDQAIAEHGHENTYNTSDDDHGCLSHFSAQSLGASGTFNIQHLPIP